MTHCTDSPNAPDQRSVLTVGQLLAFHRLQPLLAQLFRSGSSSPTAPLDTMKPEQLSGLVSDVGVLIGRDPESMPAHELADALTAMVDRFPAFVAYINDHVTPSVERLTATALRATEAQGR